MTLYDILTNGSCGVFLLLTAIQITPIKLNPWSAIAKSIGRAINNEVITKVNDLSNEVKRTDTNVKTLRNEWEAREAYLCRLRILRFGDEMLRGVRHSKEHFDQILIDISEYEQYCEKNKNFKNGVAVATINRIHDVYMERLENNDFLCTTKQN